MIMYVLYVGLFLLVMKVGLWVIKGFARPLPAPPPPGEMRRLNLRYRCSICGAEVKMTSAAEAEPEPPRHCLEDMQLVAPIE
ncbi:MAG: hypothetical protein QOG64_1300 [Acidimicrobiaceae bacterium]|nr:hypothetical protein [Acidimicrobiaceae bacterium]